MPTDLERVANEVVRFHQFLVEWFTGSCPGDGATLDDRFLRWMDPGFVIIPPGGQILTLGMLTEGLAPAHGGNPDFRIAIRNVRVHHAIRGLVAATYEEWQRHAKNSKPPNNGRISTVLFRPADDGSDELRWLQVHETWLPADVMSAGPYDF